MTDHITTLNETIKAITEDCEKRCREMSDKLLAAEIEATMAKDGLKEARLAQAAAERVATKLLTQFGLVAKVFEEAKELALAQEMVEVQQTVPPQNVYSTKPGSINYAEAPENKLKDISYGNS